MKTVVHVNQHNIKANSKDSEDRPVLTCKTYLENRYGHIAELLDASGNVVGTFRYEPEHPLSCGAKVWFETELEVRVIKRENND